ncbi:hypothetical protein HanRHA438_Chr05g0202971 [Helianthus annuus]|uniref:Uncharacterized protein n=1 Tax=Helianthus annuus TaxID=4232 RepID=A0A9K3NKZ5_HELAN|nr:hypothetical protein HanXRQr2_Chr05g0193211 [Helianthus annuus]KAJ0917164.1 hypothetical protein HanRHA438_Chr05g0202971 [Helianthus annuus]
MKRSKLITIDASERARTETRTLRIVASSVFSGTVNLGALLDVQASESGVSSRAATTFFEADRVFSSEEESRDVNSNNCFGAAC